jgi:hypothetical protein
MAGFLWKIDLRATYLNQSQCQEKGSRIDTNYFRGKLPRSTQSIPYFSSKVYQKNMPNGNEAHYPEVGRQ